MMSREREQALALLKNVIRKLSSLKEADLIEIELEPDSDANNKIFYASNDVEEVLRDLNCYWESRRKMFNKLGEDFDPLSTEDALDKMLLPDLKELGAFNDIAESDFSIASQQAEDTMFFTRFCKRCSHSASF